MEAGFHLEIHPRVDDAGGHDLDTGGMTFSDYLIDIALMAIVLLQVKGRRLTTRSLLIPLGIVGYVAVTYLHGIPTGGNNLFLIVGCAAVGATLGALAGRYTAVTAGPDGMPLAKAGLVAAGLWILGTGARFAFEVYATHGGGPAIARFSGSHGIAIAAWTAALVLMALCEVVVRTGVLAWRANALRHQAPTIPGHPAPTNPGHPAPPAGSRPGWRTIMGSSEHCG